jgi:hypothetical protein
MPSRLNALAANTRNGSRVIASTAGIESIANITSNAATITIAARNGVRPRGTRRRSVRIATVRSGSMCSPAPPRAIFHAVSASSAPST